MTTMTRQHFALIAEIIAKELDGEPREKAAYAFAYILPTTNRNFDPQRFLKACKVKAFASRGTALEQWGDPTLTEDQAAEMLRKETEENEPPFEPDTRIVWEDA